VGNSLRANEDEENDDPGFIRRHSILSAQHGFPLPALSIIPFGRSIRLNCSPRKATFANVSFFVDAFGDESTDDVQNTLSKFLNDSDERLRTFGIEDTNFQAAWNEISNLSPEEKAFCELIGSLGLAPAALMMKLVMPWRNCWEYWVQEQSATFVWRLRPLRY